MQGNKDRVLILEEGQPEYIEQGIATILRREGVDTPLLGKSITPFAGEYTRRVMLAGVTRFLTDAETEDVPLRMTLESRGARDTA